jgi:hypothetical protein
MGQPGLMIRAGSILSGGLSSGEFSRSEATDVLSPARHAPFLPVTAVSLAIELIPKR